MAITFDAETHDTSGIFATGLTFSHTVNVGADTCLVLGVTSVDTVTHTISSATYAGSALTEISSIEGSGSGITARATMLRKLAPATGANNVVITPSEEALYGIGGSAKTYFGVNQATPAGTPVTANFDTFGGLTRPTISGIGAAADELAIDHYAERDASGTGTYSADGGQTERVNNIGGSNLWLLGSEELAGDAMGWTRSPEQYGPWGYVAVALKPAAAAGGANLLGRSGGPRRILPRRRVA